jgi:hypothetical protein
MAAGKEYWKSVPGTLSNRTWTSLFFTRTGHLASFAFLCNKGYNTGRQIMGYKEATTTKLFATRCIVCGIPLRDLDSVDRGMGPECSKQGYPTDGPNKDAANKLIVAASIALTERGDIKAVQDAADKVAILGYPETAELMRQRFTPDRLAKLERKSKISIDVVDGVLSVKTPFRRKDSQDFIDAWRAIPGRRYRDKINYIPVEQKAALWALLKRFFPGQFGVGSNGVFQIPKKEIIDADQKVEEVAEVAEVAEV